MILGQAGPVVTTVLFSAWSEMKNIVQGVLVVHLGVQQGLGVAMLIQEVSISNGNTL